MQYIKQTMTRLTNQINMYDHPQFKKVLNPLSTFHTEPIDGRPCKD